MVTVELACVRKPPLPFKNACKDMLGNDLSRDLWAAL
jgi:hypothetical protein